MITTYAAQLDLLAAITDAHQYDSELVEMVIRQDAATHEGLIDPNRVRAHLRHHHPDVRPAVIGATYSGLVRRGLLARVGSVPNTDTKSRNLNKESGLYRLTP